MRRAALTVLSLLLLTVTPAWPAAEPDVPALCAQAGISCPEWASFKVKDDSRQRGPRLAFEQALLSLRDRLIRLESVSNIGADEAASLTARRLRLVDQLFEPFSIGHVGALKKRSVVPPELRSRRLDAPDGRPALLLFASSDLTYGVSAAKQARYRGVLAFLYCPGSRTWLESELFVPVESFDPAKDARQALSASCR